jgi:hypothetical protein
LRSLAQSVGENYQVIRDRADRVESMANFLAKRTQFAARNGMSRVPLKEGVAAPTCADCDLTIAFGETNPFAAHAYSVRVASDAFLHVLDAI